MPSVENSQRRRIFDMKDAFPVDRMRGYLTDLDL